MSAGAHEAPTPGLDPRVQELSAMGAFGWYLDHARSCRGGCDPEGAPNPRCDVGESLFRLAGRHLAQVKR